MKFHVEFHYPPEHREEVLRKLKQGGLQSETSVRVHGAWIAVETGTGFAIFETEDAAALYELCASWADYGQIHVTPIVGVKDI